MAQQASKTAFLDLPPELRNEIYDLYLSSIVPSGIQTVYWRDATRWYKSLAQTCRQIRNELQSMLTSYLSNLHLLVKLDANNVNALGRFLETMSEPVLAAIKSISVQCLCYKLWYHPSEHSLVWKIQYDDILSSFRLINQTGHRCYPGMPLWTKPYLILVDADVPYTASVCMESEAGSRHFKEFNQNRRRLCNTWASRMHILAGPMDVLNIGDCPDEAKALPLFLQPLVDSWKGKVFTKAGLRRLVKILETEFIGAIKERERKQEEGAEGSEESARESEEGDERSECCDDAREKFTDALMESDDEPERGSCKKSLVIRLPLKKRAGFQMFPWGVDVAYEAAREKARKRTGHDTE